MYSNEYIYRLINPQKFTFTNVAGTSVNFGTSVHYIRVHASADAYIKVGKNVTATTTDHFVRGGSGAPYYDIRVGEFEMISAVNNSGTATSTLYVSELVT